MSRERTRRGNEKVGSRNGEGVSWLSTARTVALRVRTESRLRLEPIYELLRGFCRYSFRRRILPLSATLR